MALKKQANFYPNNVNIPIFPEKSQKQDTFDALVLRYSLFSTLSHWSIFRIKNLLVQSSSFPSKILVKRLPLFTV